MATFNNTRKLSAFINKDTVFGDPKHKYTNEAFIKDLSRSYEQLYINGTSSDPILDKAQNQIDVVEIVLHAIRGAAEILEKDPDEIIKASEKIASIEEIATDSFETGLLDASKVLGLESNPLGVKFRIFCEIRRHILPLTKKIKKAEKPEKKFTSIMNPLEIETLKEELTPIKNELLSIASMPHIDMHQIETMFLNEAANEIFNPLFESKEISDSNSESEQSWKSHKKAQKDCFKKFLKLFLHQNFIFSNANFLNMLGQGHYVFINPKKRSIELSYTDEGLFFQEIFFTKKVIDVNTNKLFEPKDKDFLVKGMTKYKINICSFSKNGWVAKYDLIDSTLECDEKFKAILDTRNILEKIQEFLVTNFDKIIAYLNLDKPVKNKSKFKPLFFVSNTGFSVSEVISDNTESNGNILNVTINNMK